MECLLFNLDLGATNVSTYQVDGKNYGFVKWPGGYAVKFDPYAMTSFSEEDDNSSVWMSPMDFGVWPLYFDNGQVYSVGLTNRDFQIVKELILPESLFERLPYKNEYQKKICLGFVKKSTPSPLLSLYSGRKRRSLLFMDKSHPLRAKLTSPDLEFGAFKSNDNSSRYWPPFVADPRFPIHFKFFNQLDDLTHDGQKLMEAHILKEPGAHSVKLAILSEEEIKRLAQGSLLTAKQPLGLVLRDYGNPECLKNQNNRDYIPIYQYKLKDREANGQWNLVRYQLTAKELSPEVLFEGADQYYIPHSNPVVYAGIHNYLFFVLVDGDGKSHFKIHNLTNGAEVVSHPLPGKVHFSQPVLFKDLIFISTSEGIQLFRIVPK